MEKSEKISWLDKVTNNEEILRRVNEDGQILNSIWQRKMSMDWSRFETLRPVA